MLSRANERITKIDPHLPKLSIYDTLKVVDHGVTYTVGLYAY